MPPASMESRPEYGSLFPGQELEQPSIIGLTDLGPGNIGSINAADISPQTRQKLIGDVALPKYHQLPTNRIRCVDGRTVFGERQSLPGYADPQTAGGIVVTGTASGMMLEKNQQIPVSLSVGRNTQAAHKNGLIAVVHGDNHKKDEGCGANLKMRQACGIMVDNHDLMLEKTWALAKTLGLAGYAKPRDVTRLIVNAGVNADNDSLWDVTAGEFVNLATDNGAEYEEVVDDHNEKLIIADTSFTAFSEDDFVADHVQPDGGKIEAFVASLGVISRWKFETVLRGGGNEREAALGSLAVILFNISVPKVLTAEERGNGEALPIVILGDKYN